VQTRDRLQLVIPVAALAVVLPFRAISDVKLPDWVLFGFFGVYMISLIVMRIWLDHRYPRRARQKVNEPLPPPGEPRWRDG